MISPMCELKHEGVSGMQWHVRNGPPYPLTPAAKRRVAKRAEIIRKRKAKQEAKEQKAQERKEAKEQKAQKKINDKNAKIQKLKEQIIQKRSLKDAIKHADLFTTDELKTLKSRLDIEFELKNMKTQQALKKGEAFINKIRTTANAAESLGNLIQNGTKAYDNTAKVLNAVCGTNLKRVNDDKKRGTIQTETTIVGGKVKEQKTTTTDGYGNKNTTIVRSGNKGKSGGK